MPSIRDLLRRIQSHPALLGDCLLCHQPTQHHPLLCDECRAELPRIVYPCPRCGFPLPETSKSCGACLQHPPAWDRLRVVADYQAPYLQLIHQLKYAGKIECATLLGRLFCEANEPAPSEAGDKHPEVLLPVPLHWWRQWRRGFNQAEEIAQTLGELTGIPCDNTLLQRIKATPQQTTLSAGQRRRNLRGAFRIRPHHYRHVALLDDVVTTGATAGQLSRLLHESGITKVEVWAICRTLRHSK